MPPQLIKNLDSLNISLILISCLIAHIVPIELMLFSYAILGPAHYLTEISWLHDRQYFTGEKYDIMALFSITLLILIFSDKTFLFIILAVATAIIFSATRNSLKRAIFLPILFVFLASLSLFVNLDPLWFTVPTLIHVLIFTSLFMLFGALRNKSRLGLASFFLLYTCAMTYFIFPPLLLIEPTQYGISNFIIFASFATSLPEFIKDDAHFLQAAGFFSFIYTYHYLNWFSKTRVISWHKISKKRAFVIVALYLIFISFYLYDYLLGFKVVLLLSMLHVITELPLNMVTIKNIIWHFKPSRS